MWDGRTNKCDFEPKNIMNIIYFDPSYVLGKTRTWTCSPWKHSCSVSIIKKNPNFYLWDPIAYWKLNMFRLDPTLNWTNILLCASMAQPTIPNGQKVLFRNWSMNGQPLVSFDYNCTLNTSRSDQIPTLFFFNSK